MTGPSRSVVRGTELIYLASPSQFLNTAAAQRCRETGFWKISAAQLKAHETDIQREIRRRQAQRCRNRRSGRGYASVPIASKERDAMLPRHERVRQRSDILLQLAVRTTKPISPGGTKLLHHKTAYPPRALFPAMRRVSSRPSLSPPQRIDISCFCAFPGRLSKRLVFWKIGGECGFLLFATARGDEPCRR